MARYERDYGRDFGGRGGRGTNLGGSRRPGGWGGQSGGGWEGFDRGRQGGFASEREFGYQGGYGADPDLDRGGFGYGGASYDRGFRRGGYGAGTGWDIDRSAAAPGGVHRDGYGSSRSGGYESGSAWETGYGSGGIGYGDGWRDRVWSSTRDRGSAGTRAAEIMTENPETVTPEATLMDVARKMRDLDVGIIPVVDDDRSRRLRGVITDRDIAVRAVADGRDGKTTVGDCMTERVRSVNKNDSMQEVMRVMREEQVRRVPVTDREGRLVGIIAQADLAVDFARGRDSGRDLEVGETLERISEPAQPGRGSARMAAGGPGAGETRNATAQSERDDG